MLHSDTTLLAERVAAQPRTASSCGGGVSHAVAGRAHLRAPLRHPAAPLHVDATAVLMPKWEPGEFLALVEAERGTFSGGASAPFLQGAVDHPDLEPSTLVVAGVPVRRCRCATRSDSARWRVFGVRTATGTGPPNSEHHVERRGPASPTTNSGHRRTSDRCKRGARCRRRDRGGRSTELFLGYRPGARRRRVRRRRLVPHRRPRFARRRRLRHRHRRPRTSSSARARTSRPGDRGPVPPPPGCGRSRSSRSPIPERGTGAAPASCGRPRPRRRR